MLKCVQMMKLFSYMYQISYDYIAEQSKDVWYTHTAFIIHYNLHNSIKLQRATADTCQLAS